MIGNETGGKLFKRLSFTHVLLIPGLCGLQKHAVTVTMLTAVHTPANVTPSRRHPLRVRPIAVRATTAHTVCCKLQGNVSTYLL
jgi:hypothetical protein